MSATERKAGGSPSEESTEAAPRKPPAEKSEDELHVTRPHGPRRGIDPASVRRFRLGSHALNDLVLDDETVSRFHCADARRPSTGQASEGASRR